MSVHPTDRAHALAGSTALASVLYVLAGALSGALLLLALQRLRRPRADGPPAPPADSEHTPVKLVVVTDAGQDLDDEMALILLSHLTRERVVDCRAVIANLSPAFARARLVRGTLDILKLRSIPVGVGTDGGVEDAPDTFSEVAPYMASPTGLRNYLLEPGRLLLLRTFLEADDCSLTILLISSMKDVALFLRDNEALFARKVKEVVIMGGATIEQLGERTALVPDTAHNNEFCAKSSKFVYARCQQLGVPLVVVSRWSGYACRVSRDIYDKMADVGSVIGSRLRNAQRASIQQLWVRACAPDGSRERAGLPVRCNRIWFLGAFCGGAVTARCGDQPIWDLVVQFAMYDSIALVAAVPQLRRRFLHAVEVPNQQKGQPAAPGESALQPHLVFGLSEAQHGVARPDELVGYLRRGYMSGIGADRRVQQAAKLVLLTQMRWDNRTDDELSFVVLRSLIELGMLHVLGIVVCALPGEMDEERWRALRSQVRDVRAMLRVLGLTHIRVGTCSGRCSAQRQAQCGAEAEAPISDAASCGAAPRAEPPGAAAAHGAGLRAGAHGCGWAQLSVLPPAQGCAAVDEEDEESERSVGVEVAPILLQRTHHRSVALSVRAGGAEHPLAAHWLGDKRHASADAATDGRRAQLTPAPARGAGQRFAPISPARCAAAAVAAAQTFSASSLPCAQTIPHARSGAVQSYLAPALPFAKIPHTRSMPLDLNGLAILSGLGRPSCSPLCGIMFDDTFTGAELSSTATSTPDSRFSRRHRSASGASLATLPIFAAPATKGPGGGGGLCEAECAHASLRSPRSTERLLSAKQTILSLTASPRASLRSATRHRDSNLGHVRRSAAYSAAGAAHAPHSRRPSLLRGLAPSDGARASGYAPSAASGSGDAEQRSADGSVADGTAELSHSELSASDDESSSGESSDDDAEGDLLLELYTDAPMTGISLVVTSSLTAVAAFVRAHTGLFYAKTQSVVVVGGARLEEEAGREAEGEEAEGARGAERELAREVAAARRGRLSRDEQFLVPDVERQEEPLDEATARRGCLSRDEQFLVPNVECQNNLLDEAAACFVYRRCQELGVGLVVISRTCRMPRALYDQIERRGGELGQRIVRAQSASIQALWRRACAPRATSERMGMPDRFDRRWFCDTFCGGSSEAAALGPDDDIWPHVADFSVYTPLALLAAIPRAFEHFFRPTARMRVVVVRGVWHCVLGGLDEPTLVHELQYFLSRLVFKGLSMDRAEYDYDEQPAGSGSGNGAAGAELFIEGLGRIDLSDELPSWCSSTGQSTAVSPAPNRRHRSAAQPNANGKAKGKGSGGLNGAHRVVRDESAQALDAAADGVRRRAAGSALRSPSAAELTKLPLFATI